MFEVVEIGALSRKRWFRAQHQAVKIKAVSSSSCEKLVRSFEGHGKYTVQKHRAEFTEGEVLTVWLSGTSMLSIGDRMSVQTLAAQGCLGHCFRIVEA
jgi:hypothetical protein